MPPLPEIRLPAKSEPTGNVRMSPSQAKHGMKSKRGVRRDEERERDKAMDEEKWVQLVSFVSLLLGPLCLRSNGRADKAPVMIC